MFILHAHSPPLPSQSQPRLPFYYDHLLMPTNLAIPNPQSTKYTNCVSAFIVYCCDIQFLFSQFSFYPHQLRSSDFRSLASCSCHPDPGWPGNRIPYWSSPTPSIVPEVDSSIGGCSSQQIHGLATEEVINTLHAHSPPISTIWRAPERKAIGIDGRRTALGTFAKNNTSWCLTCGEYNYLRLQSLATSKLQRVESPQTAICSNLHCKTKNDYGMRLKCRKLKIDAFPSTRPFLPIGLHKSPVLGLK